MRPTPQIADTEATAGADLEYHEVPVPERQRRKAKRYLIGGYVHDKCKHRKKGNYQ